MRRRDLILGAGVSAAVAALPAAQLGLEAPPVPPVAEMPELPCVFYDCSRQISITHFVLYDAATGEVMATGGPLGEPAS